MVSNLTARRLSSRVWLLSWTATAPPSRVYRDGRLMLTTNLSEARVSVEPGVMPVFEVIDGADVPQSAHPPYVLLSWYGEGDAETYRIDEYADATWTQRQILPEDGRGYYLWQSRVLEDVTVHQFRVVPIDRAGNEGAALGFSVLMVRIPDVPAVNYHFDGAVAGTVTISAV